MDTTISPPLPPLAEDIVALLKGAPAVDAARLGKVRRLDVNEIPDHARLSLMPTAQPTIRDGKMVYVATVLRWGQGADQGHAVLLWSDMETRYRDRDEALEAASLRADRFAVAEYLATQGALSLPPKDSAAP